jgi:hydroxymethylbilane synthase
MIRIGTRGSPLALVQARTVADMLAAARPECTCEIVTITTEGDRKLKTALWEIGGKGLFVQEIETALNERRIDLAVHSMKDMPQEIARGLAVGAVPKREDVRDVLVTRAPVSDIGMIPTGVVVGTSSLRRRAQILRARPDLAVTSLRGNVGTRMKKLEDNEYGAVILAAAGIARLGIEARHALFLSPEDFVPAAGQGALALEVRRGEEGLVADLDDADTSRAVFCERAFVERLGASCRSAVGAWARVDGRRLTLVGKVLSPGGERAIEGERTGTLRDGYEIGSGLADDFLGRGARTLLEDG